MDVEGGAPTNPAVPTDELLRHRSFVRSLARGLVGDGALADDLEQEAWRKALERPPREASAVRTWFATVVRRLAGREARAGQRRASREQAAARPEAVAGAAQMHERLHLEKALVLAVGALDEPYRTTIFLRYFEDLSPREIAARQGLPVATVKTRLRRGLELLREALDRHEGRRDWMQGLAQVALPTAALGPAGLLPALGIAGAGVVLVGVAALFLRDRERHADALAEASPPRTQLDHFELPGAVTLTEPAPQAERNEPSPAEEPREAERRALQPKPARTTETERPQPAPTGNPESEPQLRISGRVLLPDRSPAAQAKVAFGSARTECDDAGRFELVVERESPPPGWGLLPETALVAWAEDWIPVVRADIWPVVSQAGDRSGALGPVELVLDQRALALSGTLLERDGGLATGWRIQLLDGTLIERGPYRPMTAEELCSGATGHVEVTDGAFSFGGLVPDRSYRVRAWNPRTLEQVTSPPWPAGTHGIVLRAPDEGWRPLVDGVVVGLDGLPVADVRCRLSMNEYEVDVSTWMTTGQEVRTGPDGRFAFHDVPRSAVFVRFNLDGSGAERPLDPDENGRGLRIEMVRSGAFRFETEPRPGRAITILDENDEPLRITITLAPGRTSVSNRVELAPDGSCEGGVSEQARWLVLHEDERERMRLPLVIRHGATARLRW